MHLSDNCKYVLQVYNTCVALISNKCYYLGNSTILIISNNTIIISNNTCVTCYLSNKVTVTNLLLSNCVTIRNEGTNLITNPLSSVYPQQSNEVHLEIINEAY